MIKPAKRRYLEGIAENNIELSEKNILIESLTAVVDTLTEKSKRDAEVIESLDRDLKFMKIQMD